MTLLRLENTTPSLRMASDLHTTIGRVARVIGAAAKEAYSVVLVFAIFGAILISTIALRVAVWLPTFHR